MTNVIQTLYNLDEIKRGLNAIFLPDAVIEVRALEYQLKPNYTVGGFFCDPDRGIVARALSTLSGHSRGVYYVLNQIHPLLLNRCANKIRGMGAKELTSDKDVILRRWLPVDFDAVRNPEHPISGISATDAEHKLALDLAATVVDYLIGTLGFAANSMLTADSGNGAHILVRIDVPLDKDGDRLIEDCLKALAALFTTREVEIDQKVFNRARIFKAYGTLACKGDSTLERPWRLARLLSAPDQITPISIDTLKKLAELKPTEAKPQPQSQSPSETRHFREKIDLTTWLPEHGITVRKIGDWDGWVTYEPECCPFDPAHTSSSVKFFQHPAGAIKFRCEHNGCAGKDWHDVRLKVDPTYHPYGGHYYGGYIPGSDDDGGESRPQRTYHV